MVISILLFKTVGTFLKDDLLFVGSAYVRKEIVTKALGTNKIQFSKANQYRCGNFFQLVGEFYLVEAVIKTPVCRIGTAQQVAGDG